MARCLMERRTTRSMASWTTPLHPWMRGSRRSWIILGYARLLANHGRGTACALARHPRLMLKASACGGSVGWVAGPLRAPPLKTTSIRHAHLVPQGVTTLDGCSQNDYFGCGSYVSFSIWLFRRHRGIPTCTCRPLADCLCFLRTRISRAQPTHPCPVFVLRMEEARIARGDRAYLPVLGSYGAKPRGSLGVASGCIRM